jgi:hypothetical protein
MRSRPSTLIGLLAFAGLSLLQAQSALAQSPSEGFSQVAPVCPVSQRGLSKDDLAIPFEPPPFAEVPKAKPPPPVPVFPSTMFGYKVTRHRRAPFRVSALESERGAGLRLPELSPAGARTFAAQLGGILGFAPMPPLKLVRHTHAPASEDGTTPPIRTFVFDQAFGAGTMTDGPGVEIEVNERTRAVISLTSSLISESDAHKHLPLFSASDAERALLELRPNLVVGFRAPFTKTHLRLFAQADGTLSVVWAVPARHTSCEPGHAPDSRHPYLAAIDANNLALLGYFDWNLFREGVVAHGGVSCFDPVVEHLPLQ